MAERRAVTSEAGFTLVETIASLALLAMLTVIAYGIIQSTDRLMRRGAEQAQIAQSTRAAVEHLKEAVHMGVMPLACEPGGKRGEFAVDGIYWATYVCVGEQQGMQHLYRFDVDMHKASALGPTVDSFSFLVTRGGY